ncbi:MAG: glycosyltransferase family 39 protein [Deferribacteres bacterium]|nr:glycosyltransferase family 39 protein [candidate division KSB1 bacterium]MCB9503368.1 glycosyltransferase family 39 protein [Deferribacteres bacterium]
MKTKNLFTIFPILIAGFLFRLFLLKYHWVIGFDEVHYVRLGLSAVQNGFSGMLHPYWPPFYPALIGLLSVLIKDGELAARILNILVSLISVYMIYRLAKECISERIALLAAFAFAFYPPLAFDSTTALAETVYTALGLAGIWSGWLAIKKRSLWYGFLVGIFSGCAYLTKPEGVHYVMVFVGIVAVIFLLQIKKKQFKLTAIIATSLLGFFICSLPYLVYVKNQMGMWTLSMKFQVNQQFSALSLSKDKSPEARFSLTKDNKYLPTDLAYHEGNFQLLIDQNTASGREKKVDIGSNLLLKKFVKNFHKVNTIGVPVALSFAPFLLVVLGLFARPWDWPQIKFNSYILAYIFFWWFLAIPLFHINLRYFTPQLPLVFIWLALGITFLKESLDVTFGNAIKSLKQIEFLKPKYLSILVTSVLLLGFSYVPELGKIIKHEATDPDYWAEAVELKKAGLWLKEHGGKNFRVMSENKAVEYYAGLLDTRSSISFPIDKEFDRVLEYAHYKNVDYMVITSRYSSHLQNVEFLLEPENAPSSLQLVYDDVAPGGIKTVIYKLVK